MLALLTSSLARLRPSWASELLFPFTGVRCRTEADGACIRYPADHAFATALKGSDNIISFTTKRYSPRPLIIQGAGAGADVTAMGVTVSLFVQSTYGPKMIKVLL